MVGLLNVEGWACLTLTRTTSMYTNKPQEDEEINLEAYDVPLREWIAEDRTRREVSPRV